MVKRARLRTLRAAKAMPESRDFQITDASAGARLDHFLAAEVPVLSRSRIQQLIADGFVTLNARSTRSSARLRLGDAISLREPLPVPTETRPEKLPLDVLFEDADFIVVNKPAGMVVHPAAGNWGGTLVNALLHHCGALSGIGGEQRPGIVHRLDKETSGCIVAAKNDAAHQSLAKQFAGREVTKIYLALVAGKFRRASGVIEQPIGRHPVQRKKMAVLASGRAAKTSYRLVREIAAGTLVECTLHTGRTHQIRVHLQHLGHPLLGDEVYGKRGRFPRQMLHAWRLGFAHPRTGERVLFEAKLPEDFAAAIGATSISDLPSARAKI